MKSDVLSNKSKIKLNNVETSKRTIFVKSNRDEVVFSTSMINRNPLKPSPKIDIRHSQFQKEPFKLRRNELSPIPRRFPVIPNSLRKDDNRLKAKEII